MTQTSKEEWVKARCADHDRRQQLRQAMLQQFSGFEAATGGRYRYGEMITCRFGRRTWAIEVWCQSNEWSAGLYIVEQVNRHNYWWEMGTGKTQEEAISRLKLRIGTLWEELAAISSEVRS